MRTDKNKTVRSLPIYVIETIYPDDTLDLSHLVKMDMAPAPVLWCFEGTYYLVPMEHVADIMDAIRHHLQAKKEPWSPPTISMGDATAINYDIGWALSRRHSQKRINGDKPNRK